LGWEKIAVMENWEGKKLKRRKKKRRKRTALRSEGSTTAMKKDQTLKGRYYYEVLMGESSTYGGKEYQKRKGLNKKGGKLTPKRRG